MTMTAGRIQVCLLLGLAVSLVGTQRVHAQEYVRNSVPEMFSYDELVQLSTDQELKPKLAEKLHTLTTTPFINNEAYYRGAKPRPLEVEVL
jgi:hypothetical protein